MLCKELALRLSWYMVIYKIIFRAHSKFVKAVDVVEWREETYVWLWLDTLLFASVLDASYLPD